MEIVFSQMKSFVHGGGGLAAIKKNDNSTEYYQGCFQVEDESNLAEN